MIIKLMTGILVFAAVGLMLTGRRATALANGKVPPRAPRVPRAEDLVKCTRCGVWLPSGMRCDCASRA